MADGVAELNAIDAALAHLRSALVILDCTGESVAVAHLDHVIAQLEATATATRSG